MEKLQVKEQTYSDVLVDKWFKWFIVGEMQLFQNTGIHSSLKKKIIIIIIITARGKVVFPNNQLPSEKRYMKKSSAIIC